MQFLTNGDFGFPFTSPLFFVKQFYMWSYQTGAANADGIIRMPSRLLDLVVFAMFGNLAFEYFFIFSSLAIVFASFYYFAKRFLEVKSISTRLLAATFYTCNPIFLGNLSKIGLVLAAAMLPLCLVMVRQFFVRKRFSYLVVWLIFLNISLIHPFTFAVNFVVSAGYLLYQATLYRKFVLSSLPKFVLIGGLFILMNTYFLLPLASMHTVSKNALSDTITSTPTDYTALVDVLNTGNIFTGLSLSKNVVLDYDFYNSTYANLYFLGAFAFYALLLFLYLRVEKTLSLSDKRRAALLFGAFVLLIILATVTFLHIDALIRLLINTPGGWAFRSPLKWQLYIPLTLFGLLALFMKYVPDRRPRFILYGVLVAAFLLMDGFLVGDIYKKLLVPRHIQYFQALQQTNLDHQNILFVNGSQCWEYEQDHPRIMNELNQVLSSQNVQIKRVNVSDMDLVNLGAYDYVLSCQDIVQPYIAHNYQFKLSDTFATNAFQFYTNQAAKPYAYAANTAFLVPKSSQLGDTSDFVAQQLHQNFNFVNTPSVINMPLTNLQDVFSGLSSENIHGNTIRTAVQISGKAQQALYTKGAKQPLYYQQPQAGQLLLTTKQQTGYTQLPANSNIPLPAATASGKLTVTYTDAAYDYKNLIPNASFETGLWQKTVGDCYDFDDEPEISMSLDHKDSSNGHQSLQLQSSNHIACTGPNPIKVKAGQQYLLSFDYWSPDNDASYYLTFDDQQSSVLSGHLTSKDTQWHTFTKIITIPNDARTMRLQVESFPDDSGKYPGISRFDNFKVIGIPDIQGHFYLTDKQSQTAPSTPAITTTVTNPTKNTIHIKQADQPFYLVTSESYSSEWRLEPMSPQARSWSPFASVVSVPATDHLKLNDEANGWYINPTAICKQTPASCSRQPDGSYDMNLVMEYTPQRWFYAGAFLSATAFIGAISYCIYDMWQNRSRGAGYKRWQ